MNKTKQTALKWPVLAAYAVAFYGIWALFELRGRFLIESAVGSEWLAQLIRSGVVKNLVWTLPAILLVRHYEARVSVSLKDMFALRAPSPKYLLAGALLQKGRIALSEAFSPSDLIVVLFVGITEEMVFRGWLLNATARGKKMALPLLVNALMFLLIHLPIWIREGQLVENFRNLSFLGVLILSLLFGWTFLKSRSLWIPILLHMYWDLLIFLFY